MRGCRTFKCSVSSDKPAREKELNIILDLVNQIKVKRVIRLERDFSTVVNYYESKKDALEKANYRNEY